MIVWHKASLKSADKLPPGALPAFECSLFFLLFILSAWKASARFKLRDLCGHHKNLYPPVLALLSEVLPPLLEGIFVMKAAAACPSAAAMAANAAVYEDAKAQKRIFNLSKPLETCIVT